MAWTREGPTRMREESGSGTAGIMVLTFASVISFAQWNGDLTPAFVFGGVGVFVLLNRNGRVLDGSRGILEQWWGLGRPLWRRTVTLDAFRTVALSRETHRRREKGRTHVWEGWDVALDGPGEREVLDSFGLDNLGAARAFADVACGCTGLPLRDASLEPTVSELDENLRE